MFKPFARFVALTTCLFQMAPAVRADEVSDLKAMVQTLAKHTEALQKELGEVKEELREVRGDAKAPQVTAPVAASQGAPIVKAVLRQADAVDGQVPAKTTHGFMERKPGKAMTFYTPGNESTSGELTTYANFDLALDGATKGISSLAGPDGAPPVGKVGWLPALSTNISFIGVRGFTPLGDTSMRVVYQFETQLDITATSGTGETNSSESNVVKSGLTSRNTFVGIASDTWGAIKFGKTDAPYKNSTMRMDPFYGMQGDYQVIMGNTGGDNRVEFGTRLDHSIWYESPAWKGLSFNALFSPGQNRASNSDNIAAGESDCTGGNIPGSGGIIPVSCSDGSFSDAMSASLSYTKKRLYVVAAYERHKKVNRSSDITGLYGSNNAYSQMLEAQDTADEDAAKIGVQYRLGPRTSVGGIFESMHRYVPQDLEFQNERQRNGTWLTLSQGLNQTTSVHLGWAHAFRTPGDPGQHNDSLETPPGGVPGEDATAGANSSNQANLFSLAVKRQITPTFGIYSSWAATMNGPAAHYDLGAGGRGVTTDCHDASDATGGLVGSNPHCWTGGHLQGASVGLDWKF